MIALKLSQWQEFCQGQLIGQDITVSQIETDTRNIQKGALFVALRGEKFDGHDYLLQAVEKGACAVLVEQQSSLNIPQIVVADTRLALGALAKGLRQQLAIPCCSMTGSNGKTSVKELCAGILQQQYRVLATGGNFNNDIGVPLTLLRLQPQHQRAVIELGANHAGEIAYTASLAAPEVGLVNNIAAAHIEGFASEAGVAAAKSELFQALPRNGLAIAPLNHSWREQLDKAAQHCRRQYFDINDAQADYFTTELKLLGLEGSEFTLHTPIGHARIRLQLAGAHNVSNALAASAIAIAMGANLASVVTGLAAAQSVRGRLNTRKLSDGITVIDDSYNANPQSFLAATSILESMSGRRILVAGDMGELGDICQSAHQQVASKALASGIELWTCGPHFGQLAMPGQHSYLDQAELNQDLIASLGQEPSAILVKGSRSAAMEKVAQAIIHKFSENNEC
ncbi:UDP-N-acetylmuramoyl-tripeptide--D-alanyl-D-alanine ligase [Alginatibacterium sediminis]|uniref:UDP-N-acetylmuramoyl-tripeptide--D-alanyl-D-alanine ligase n=1 Tax=Alginatibacterium sediminis TaxID=2164068 RepID=A0A420E979_9ALTE|nr:UDP-N-acetylmuramoyl-tripeptide--D-alanyl-D-alanine ligase [Alginatibacterium sediminis]RKF15888.1 UDP-N-acetylmuramoyl-tripeptide--D-alanyl-D-alanine ligase [Alginatibacterium sediminis]